LLAGVSWSCFYASYSSNNFHFGKEGGSANDDDDDDDDDDDSVMVYLFAIAAALHGLMLLLLLLFRKPGSRPCKTQAVQPLSE
jgi:hypothetical protein